MALSSPSVNLDVMHMKAEDVYFSELHVAVFPVPSYCTGDLKEQE